MKELSSRRSLNMFGGWITSLTPWTKRARTSPHTPAPEELRGADLSDPILVPVMQQQQQQQQQQEQDSEQPASHAPSSTAFQPAMTTPMDGGDGSNSGGGLQQWICDSTSAFVPELQRTPESGFLSPPLPLSEMTVAPGPIPQRQDLLLQADDQLPPPQPPLPPLPLPLAQATAPMEELNIAPDGSATQPAAVLLELAAGVLGGDGGTAAMLLDTKEGMPVDDVEQASSNGGGTDEGGDLLNNHGDHDDQEAIPLREEAGAEIAMLADCDADNDDEVNEDAAAAAAITAAADNDDDDDDDDDDDEPMWTAEQAEDIVYESEDNEQEQVMSTDKQPTGPVTSRPSRPSASSSSSVAASEAGSHVLRHPAAANRDPPDDATHAASHITYPRELVWRYYDGLAQQSGHTQPHSARGYSRHHNRMQHRLPAWTPW
eukprot:COSAG01_NODE_397_length_17560_cov_111.258347_21_plen_431_part_00